MLLIPSVKYDGKLISMIFSRSLISLLASSNVYSIIIRLLAMVSSTLLLSYDSSAILKFYSNPNNILKSRNFSRLMTKVLNLIRLDVESRVSPAR